MPDLLGSGPYIGPNAGFEKGQRTLVPADGAAARKKESVALWSIAASAVITLGKGFAGLATGSLALISDAAHSALDVAATTLTYFAVRSAGKPADAEHHYGHGKIESLAALVETALLFVLSGAVALEGVRRLSVEQAHVEPSWTAVWILVAAIAIDGWRWITLKRTAGDTGSEALEADALHFASDLVNSVLVLVALGATAAGFPMADAAVAVLVALFIALAGFRLARGTIATLLDTAPKGLAEQVRSRVERIGGVVAVDRVRIRPSGGVLIGEVLVRVSRTLPLDRVAEIKARISAAIAEDLPRAEFTITTEPIQLDDESILERVLLIGTRLRVPVHHVVVQNVGSRLSINFDLEVDAHMTLGGAHEVASRVEAAIIDEFGPGVEVESHIEPLVAAELEGREADAATIARIAHTLAACADRIASLADVHNVRVRRTQSGLIVNFHCRADPAIDVACVHELVDRLERDVRAEHPEVLRIVGHAEPLERAL
jgi:cation diffusion facilitator family transporter